jgi:SAM-dependent methyltransferase
MWASYDNLWPGIFGINEILPRNRDDTVTQVKSKQRVAEHGEVFTSLREVNAMLDLVKQETERIESRFLEPACGTGNFLSEILRRKLNIVEKRYAKSQFDFERNAVIAVSSVYGIDIQEDNVLECRERLFRIFDEEYYSPCFKDACKAACRDSIRYILSLNIVWGDALTLMTVGETPGYIVFSEWSPINGSLIKRRDFTFHSMIQNESLSELELFSFISDQGEEVYIPSPERDYPPTHFLELAHAYK